MSKVHIRIFRRTARHRCIRCQRAFAERFEGIPIEERCQFIVFEHFNFLNFMRRSEAVKEIDKRHAAFNRR